MAQGRRRTSSARRPTSVHAFAGAAEGVPASIAASAVAKTRSVSSSAASVVRCPSRHPSGIAPPPQATKLLPLLHRSSPHKHGNRISRRGTSRTLLSSSGRLLQASMRASGVTGCAAAGPLEGGADRELRRARDHVTHRETLAKPRAHTRCFSPPCACIGCFGYTPS
jgi:hypothetical protein